MSKIVLKSYGDGGNCKMVFFNKVKTQYEVDKCYGVWSVWKRDKKIKDYIDTLSQVKEELERLNKGRDL